MKNERPNHDVADVFGDSHGPRPKPKFTPAEAEKMGKEAYHKGISRASVLDEEFEARLVRAGLTKVGSSVAHAKAWLKGWTKAWLKD